MENLEKAENSLEGAIKGPSLPLFIISGRPERSWDLSKTWIFSSCGGILELQRGIQASSCVGPGSPIFHSTCQRELAKELMLLNCGVGEDS